MNTLASTSPSWAPRMIHPTWAHKCSSLDQESNLGLPAHSADALPTGLQGLYIPDKPTNAAALIRSRASDFQLMVLALLPTGLQDCLIKVLQQLYMMANSQTVIHQMYGSFTEANHMRYGNSNCFWQLPRSAIYTVGLEFMNSHQRFTSNSVHKETIQERKNSK